jgi:hypothetical protein
MHRIAITISRVFEKSCPGSNADFHLFLFPATGRLWRLGGVWHLALRTTTRRLLESAPSTSTCRGGGCEPPSPLLGRVGSCRGASILVIRLDASRESTGMLAGLPAVVSASGSSEIWNVNKTCREPVSVEGFTLRTPCICVLWAHMVLWCPWRAVYDMFHDMLVY